jgi:hypothetical protein
MHTFQFIPNNVLINLSDLLVMFVNTSNTYNPVNPFLTMSMPLFEKATSATCTSHICK